jgi:hypothetical protein
VRGVSAGIIEPFLFSVPVVSRYVPARRIDTQVFEYAVRGCMECTSAPHRGPYVPMRRSQNWK